MNEPISAREDFYRHVNGAWLDATPIPDDQSTWGTQDELEARTRMQLESLIERLGSHPKDRDERKIVSLYASFMDEARVESAGVAPISLEWNRIDALTDKQQIPVLIAHLNATGVRGPHQIVVHQDARDATNYVIDMRQGGLGLPSRDYYSAEDARSMGVRERYLAHIKTMMRLAGARDESAEAIMDIETELARHQWSLIENRDPIKTYNPYRVTDLSTLTGAYDWRSYFVAAGAGDQVKWVTVSQPSYLTAYARLVESRPLSAWQDYFKWRVLSAAAPYLSSPFVSEQFAFYGTFFRGIPTNEPRAQRAVRLVNEVMGDALGQLYVKQYLSPKTKDDIDATVQVVLAAFRTQLQSLDWMSKGTRKAAQQKLNALVVKIGSPIRYRDYNQLTISSGDLFGNISRGAVFEHQRSIGKLGKPIDRDGWQVLPQGITAYYDPQLNEVAFPAALLQAPFYDEHADLATHYGGIGVVIAREIARAFDDVGSHYAANGRLDNWFAGTDHDRFYAIQKALIAQYDHFEALPGQNVSGTGTLGENLAETASVALAYQAYHLALAGAEAPLIGGLSGNQCYFVSYSHVSRSKTRAAAAELQQVSDPRVPASVRVDAVLANQPSFASTFALERGDKMYRTGSERVTVW